MKRLLLILSAFLCISGCNNQSETPIETPPAAIVANEESFRWKHSFQYGEEGATWYGMVQNATDQHLQPFNIELYITFKDGNEYLATTIPIDGMNPDEIYKLDEDITEVYRQHKYSTDDNKSYRIAITQPK